ncbi:MAG: 5-methyltetrahydropteroyltriglutamate--homocysteine methyltransferase [Candidatus Electrothrix sp. AR3]|nr:5-methyltetrahydropteroyltriglutamate--homocysteine methyltransferase [Candidatus Electrothrix sp. AR3]
MAVLTATVGAYPKPTYLSVPDWFQNTAKTDSVSAYNQYLKHSEKNSDQLLNRATQDVVKEQADLGIDFPTDGEVRRENYIHYHCRHLDGIDFSRLTEKSMRCGAWVNKVPTITGPVRGGEHFLVQDWEIAQSVTKRPVTATLPGPLTLNDSLADAYYGDERQLCRELADALRHEVLALADAGCQRIQIDEPLFARQPEKALAFGIENLERCFHKLPRKVSRIMHICCGYPAKVDDENYSKALPEVYFRLADPLDEAALDVVSLEDAHRKNDLTLLEHFRRTTVIFGVIAIARTRIEQVDEVAFRLQQALEHIDAERLIAAPDCGLGMLNHATVTAKLKNMVQAAKIVG